MSLVLALQPSALLAYYESGVPILKTKLTYLTLGAGDFASSVRIRKGLNPPARVVETMGQKQLLNGSYHVPANYLRR
jgi:hypothetical protein